MIVDCHGHYTTAPDELGDYREKQKSDLANDPMYAHTKGLVSITCPVSICCLK